MSPDEYGRMYALEDWYWWFVARRAAVSRFLRDFAPEADGAPRPLRILDAGCGTGGMLDVYRTWPDAEAVGLDFAPQALEFSRSRGHERLVAGDLRYLPFRTGSFHVVTAMDVIEHVPDDARAVAEISRVLVPGGILVATVPAYQFLWGPHDEVLHHYRRYRGPQFRRLLSEAGLYVERQTYLLSALFPAAALQRLLSRRRTGAAALPEVPRALNQALVGFQAAELAVARRVPLPFGLSVLAVARKPVPARVIVKRVEEQRVPVPVAR